MARTLDSDVSGVKDGGEMYAYVRFEKNTSDDWGAGITYDILGTIQAESFAGSDENVLTGRLLDISDIDNSADIFSTPLAKISDVKVKIQNLDQTITPSKYMGRKISVYIGGGSSMSENTSDSFFTGRVISMTTNRDTIIYTCRGLGELRNKEIGEILNEQQFDKYRGKMIPISHGDWTDEDAYLPIIIQFENNDNLDIRNTFSEAPIIKTDTRPWVDYQNLFVYDENLQRGIRTNTAQFTVNSDENELNFFIDTTTTLGDLVNSTRTDLPVIDRSKINFHESNDTDVAPQTVILVEDEQMLLDIKPSDWSVHPNRIRVERGYNGTKAASHSLPLKKIFQLSEDAAKLKIKCSDIFYPEGFANQNIDVVEQTKPEFISILTETGSYQSLKGGAGEKKYAIELDTGLARPVFDINFDLVFPDFSISGEILNMYVIANITASATIISNGPFNNQASRISLFKGDLSSGLGNQIARTDQETPGTETNTFNNIDGSDDEEDLPFINDNLISDISEFGNTRYYLNYGGLFRDIVGSIFGIINKIGIRIDFGVNPLEYDFFARGEARKNPGGYFNGSSGDLIESPSIVIEDFCRNDVPTLTASDLDETYFDDFETDRASWKLASTITSD